MQQILKDLFLVRDTCNVYLLRRGDRAVAIDFGSGAWIDGLPGLGVRGLDHVLLTHHHVDQCSGLAARRPPDCTVHAPPGEQQFLDPQQVEAFWRSRRGKGCPPSYSVLTRGLPGVTYDLAESGDLLWHEHTLRIVPTPGHGPNAGTVVANWQGKQLAFCGDAAHADATVWEPYHLEWDHWTGHGALMAWQGVRRLSQIGMDLLCPSHGPLIAARPRTMLNRLAAKLLKLHDAKLSICPGEKDELLPGEPVTEDALRIMPHLFHFGRNGFLLLSDPGEALVVDPMLPDLEALERLLTALGKPRLTAALASHYHADHCDAMPELQRRYGTKACLHPWVAKPLADHTAFDLPWMTAFDIRPDVVLPEDGTWHWQEYAFRVAPFPAQTWWHAAHQTLVDGVRVFFGGDNFQPAARWNGTGGFCAYNGCRFREGWMRSAQLVLDWAPHVMCNGHKAFYRVRPSRFRRIQRWALKAERAVTELCPEGDLDRHYYMHTFGESLPYPST